MEGTHSKGGFCHNESLTVTLEPRRLPLEKGEVRSLY